MVSTQKAFSEVRQATPESPYLTPRTDFFQEFMNIAQLETKSLVPKKILRPCSKPRTPPQSGMKVTQHSKTSSPFLTLCFLLQLAHLD